MKKQSIAIPICVQEKNQSSGLLGGNGPTGPFARKAVALGKNIDTALARHLRAIQRIGNARFWIETCAGMKMGKSWQTAIRRIVRFGRIGISGRFAKLRSVLEKDRNFEKRAVSVENRETMGVKPTKNTAKRENVFSKAVPIQQNGTNGANARKRAEEGLDFESVPV